MTQWKLTALFIIEYMHRVSQDQEIKGLLRLQDLPGAIQATPGTVVLISLYH